MKVSGPRWDAAGGVHRLPSPDGATGTLLACAVDVVGPDPEAALDEFAVDTVVCLMERDDLDRRFPDYVRWLDGAIGGSRAVWAPAPDHGVVPDVEAASLAADVRSRLERGTTVLLHCGAGYGRTGVLAVQVLASGTGCPGGRDLEATLAAVRTARPACGPQSDAQHEQLWRLCGDGIEGPSREGA